MPTTSGTVEAKSHTLRMQGAPLFRLAVKRLEQAIREIVKEFGVDVQDIAQLVLHQANGRILDQLTKRLGVSPERVCSVIGRYGNTSSASLPIALDYAVRSGKDSAPRPCLAGLFWRRSDVGDRVRSVVSAVSGTGVTVLDGLQSGRETS